AVGWLPPGTKIFRGIELRLDRRGDGFGDLVLHREHIDKAAIVPFCPDVTASSDVVELRGDAHVVVAFAYAALYDIADDEFLGDLRHMDGLPLVDERGVAGDDEEPAQLR